MSVRTAERHVETGSAFPAPPVDFTRYGPYVPPDRGDGPVHEFDGRIRADGSTPFLPERGRYHLYLALGCPFSHRTAIILSLLGLETVISWSLVDDLRDGRGWAFREARGPDPVNGFSHLSQAYRASRPEFDGYVSCPTLWDRETGRVVSNTSGNIVIDLLTQFRDLADHWIDLYPEVLRADIDSLSARILEDVGIGAYMVGFAREQADYDARVTRLFAMLDLLEQRLARNRYLFGSTLTETDIRLWATLARFDIAYHPLFRANLRRIADYPNLWAYARDLYGQPAFRTLSWFEDIKRVYFGMFPALNPTGIVPVGPILDWHAPQQRATLA